MTIEKFIKENTQDVYWKLDENFNMVELSGNTKNLYGLDTEDIFKMPVLDRYPEMYRKQIQNAIADGLAMLKGKDGCVKASVQVEMYCFREDKTRYLKPVLITCWAHVVDNQITFIEGLTRDISEHVQQLQQAERIKCIGGICHSLAQPLQSISGIVDILQLKMDSQEDIEKWIEKLRKQVDAASAIFENLHRVKHDVSAYKLRPYLDGEIIDLEV